MNSQSGQNDAEVVDQPNAADQPTGNTEESRGSSSLLPCLDRLARLQNTPVASIDLQEAIGRSDRSKLTRRKVRRNIVALARRLGSPKPEFIKRPEPANMPLLHWSAAKGFGVLRGQNAMSEWILEVWDEREQIWREQVVDSLQDGELIKVSLVKVYRASKSPVYELIGTEVFSHKKILTEVILAGFVVNIIALATSFYTMLVYDRVVPTGAGPTPRSKTSRKLTDGVNPHSDKQFAPSGELPVGYG